MLRIRLRGERDRLNVECYYMLFWDWIGVMWFYIDGVDLNRWVGLG
jgi:hypothetical protein